ncbi:MAG: DUF1249 domain-containing protein, partial [Gammaproteobacteria bacterium]|nr:DUF1249 domain-containing protein [Gammaproteobacteria bacterium]
CSLVSRTPGDCDLHLAVDVGSRYTRSLRLTYLFDEKGGPVAEPDLAVRLYLDARVAEVMAWAECHRHPALNEIARGLGQEINRRWARNMVLSKWLDFLLDNGHTYAVAGP